MWIYREGYYTNWDENDPLIFAKRVGNGITGALVNEVVIKLVKCGFFDETVFNSFGILTSEGIQKRWQKIISDSNRVASILPEYDLTKNSEISQKSDFNKEKSDFIREKSEEIPEKSEVMQQRKVKEKKEKNKKEEKVPASAETPPKIDFINSILNVFSEEYEKARGIEFVVINKEIERTAIGKLQNIMRKKYPEANTEQIQEKFRTYFAKCLLISDPWHNGKMSPMHIYNKFNEINQLITNGASKNGTNGKISSFERARELNKGKFDGIINR